MVYLEDFTFPDEDMEFSFFLDIKRTCYDSYYPFQILSSKGLKHVNFEPITILYGGNGSGKSTALNIIAEKLNIHRDSVFNKSNFYPKYLSLCKVDIMTSIPSHSKIITSDDVFDYMLNIRNLNEGIDTKRDELFGEYLDTKYSHFQMKSISDYDELKRVNKSRRLTQSKFVRDEVMDNIREMSNGESAFKYFVEKIEDNGLYILDEPENSLSPKMQLEFKEYIENAARFFGCQFIISTHSPFLLSMKDAKIYDLDYKPVKVSRWTELENVRTYFDFFETHLHQFT